MAETVSGSVCAQERPGFVKLIDRMEEGDILVVTKLDRLGRNALDVTATVAELATIGVRVHCLALGGVDLTSSTGKLTMGVINAVAEFERDLLIERTQAGLARAREEGRALGPPHVLTPSQRAQVRERLAAGESVAALARVRHQSADDYARAQHLRQSQDARRRKVGTATQSLSSTLWYRM